MNNKSGDTTTTGGSRSSLDRAFSKKISIASKHRKSSIGSNSTFTTMLHTADDVFLDDTKSLVSPKLSMNLTSTGTPMSSLTSPKSSIIARDNQSHVRSQAQISNFFDLQQIRNALQGMKGSTQKIKFIDFIINRRKEIKNLEEQTRVDKIAPMVKQFTDNFRRRRTETQMSFSQTSSFFSQPIGPMMLISKHPQKEGSEPQDNALTCKISEGRSLESLQESSLERIRKFFLQKGFAKLDKDSQEQLKVSTDQTNNLESPALSLEEIREVSQERKNKIQFRGHKINLGNETLKNDLYKFLRRNKVENRTTSLLLNTSESKNPNIRAAEREAEMRFDCFQAEKRRSVDYLRTNVRFTEAPQEKNKCNPHSHKLKESHKNLRLLDMESPSRHPSQKGSYLKDRTLDLLAFTHLPSHHQKGRSFVSSVNSDQTLSTKSTVRKIRKSHLSIFKESIKGQEGGVMIKMIDDDSFISTTETKLDYLYKATFKLNQKIKENERKFWAAKDRSMRTELENILKSKRQKRDEYLREINTMTHEKIG